MICVYEADCIDFTNNGIGLLEPQSCTVTETLNGGLEVVDGGVYEEVLAFDSGAKFVVRADNPLQPTLRCFGHVVELHGEIQPTASISGSTTYYAICTLPEKYAPHHDLTVLQQGICAT